MRRGAGHVRRDGRTLAVVDKHGSRYWSDDGGQIWSAARVSNAEGQVHVALKLGNGDVALFAATRSAAAGVSGVNTMAPVTAGSIACSFSTQLGLERVYRANPEARDLLGCPNGDETQRRIRTSQVQIGSMTVYGYWVLDDSPDLYIADDDSVTRSGKERGWPYQGQGQTERTVDGFVQSFEGGQMLYIPATDATHPAQILVMGLQTWRTYPDAPP